MNPDYLRESADGVILSVKLVPRASRNAIQGPHGNELKISVTAPPVDSAANQALVEFLSGLWRLPKGAVQILRGHTSRHKTVLLRGISASQYLAQLPKP